jgi:Sec-independent protein translocase protein TatA
MMSDALAPGHVLVVLLVALVVLGPTEIPKAVRGVARVRREVALLRTRLDEGLHSMLDVDEPGRGAHPAEVEST